MALELDSWSWRWREGAAGLLGARAGEHHLLAVLEIVALAVALARARRLGVALLGLAVAVLLAFLFLAGALAVLGLLAFLGFLGLVGFRIGVGAHVQVVQQILQAAREGILVAQQGLELFQGGAGLGPDLVAPQLHGGFGRGRRLQAGEHLAGDQAHGVGQGNLLAGDGAVQPVGAGPHLQHFGDIGGGAGHQPGAQGLDPGLLDHLVDLAGVGTLRHPPLVQAVIVIAKAQRDGIGGAAQPVQIRLDHRARRGRQPHLHAPDAAIAGGEAHVQVGAAGHGLQGGGGGAPDHLSGAFAPVAVLAGAVALQRRSSIQANMRAGPSGRSAPKQRW